MPSLGYEAFESPSTVYEMSLIERITFASWSLCDRHSLTELAGWRVRVASWPGLREAGPAGLALIIREVMREEAVESLVVLEYPNGGMHEAVLTGASAMQPGDEFELYGRRWRAVELVPHMRKGVTSRYPRRMLCRPTDEPHAQPGDSLHS